MKTQLEARVRWCVENPQISPSSVDVDVDLLINGTNLLDSPEICLFSADSVYYDDADATKVMRFDLTVSIHNRMKKLLDPQSLSLALIVPKALDASGETASYSHFPDGRMLCTLIPKFSLFPDGWQFMNFSLYFKENTRKRRHRDRRCVILDL